jgi:hypothetical protein
MEEEPVKESGGQGVESCPCRDIEEHLAALIGIRSPAARQHLRNARIEMLKALRSVIDDRIEHLSRAAAKGTKIAVD